MKYSRFYTSNLSNRSAFDHPFFRDEIRQLYTYVLKQGYRAEIVRVGRMYQEPKRVIEFIWNEECVAR